MKAEELPDDLKLPAKHLGNERVFIKCIHCSRPAFYDYLPYSLQNPVRWLLCGHGNPYDDAVNIQEDEFCARVMGLTSGQALKDEV